MSRVASTKRDSKKIELKHDETHGTGRWSAFAIQPNLSVGVNLRKLRCVHGGVFGAGAVATQTAFFPRVFGRK